MTGSIQAAIFLRINEKYNQKEPVSRPRSSFAQQIYTLYNDAFFMKEGVIGTLAEQHLRTTYKKLLGLETRLDSGGNLGKKKTSEDRQVLEEAKGIIDCLDEPLLKGHLQLLYDQCQKESNRHK